MSIQFYPIDHLPVGPVVGGRNMPHPVQGGGLRLTDYPISYSSGYVLNLSMYDNKKYLFGGSAAWAYGQVGFRESNIFDNSEWIFFGVECKIINLPVNLSSTSYPFTIMRISDSVLGEQSGTVETSIFVFDYKDLGDFTVGDVFYLEMSMKIGPTADGIAKRWINGRRISDQHFIRAKELDLLTNRTAYFTLISNASFGYRNMYLAGDCLPNPVTKRIGPISEQRLELEVVTSNDWTSNDGQTINEFLNRDISNNTPYNQYIRTDSNASLKYKVVESNLPTLPIIGVVGVAGVHKDVGLGITQNVNSSATTVLNKDNQMVLGTQPYLLNTIFGVNDFNKTVLDTTDILDLTIEHTFVVTDED